MIRISRKEGTNGQTVCSFVLTILKIFTTQVLGRFQEVLKKEMEHIEDASRILAQTILSEGNIYFTGTKELTSVPYTATLGEETLPKSAHLNREQHLLSLTSLDCVVLFSKDERDDETTSLLQMLKETEATIIGISASGTSFLQKETPFHISYHLEDGLLPTDNGKRTGYPHSLLAQYVYYTLYFTTLEILEEYDE